MAGVLSDILLSRQQMKLVYHVESPIRQPWAETIDHWRLKSGCCPEAIPFDQWLGQACSKPCEDADFQSLQSLEGFFRDDFIRMATGAVSMQVDNTLEASQTMRRISKIDRGLIEAFGESWGLSRV